VQHLILVQAVCEKRVYGQAEKEENSVKPRSGYNPKRKIAPIEAMSAEQRSNLANRCSYGGNPQHKRDPADYGLTPPASPRPGKTLCDASGPISKQHARALLEAGLTKGMISVRLVNGWPQNVWAVASSGEAFEAQLENREQGIYHGYPVPIDDDFRTSVLEEWEQR
jgi:hypothetical protein